MNSIGRVSSDFKLPIILINPFNEKFLRKGTCLAECEIFQENENIKQEENFGELDGSNNEIFIIHKSETAKKNDEKIIKEMVPQGDVPTEFYDKLIELILKHRAAFSLPGESLGKLKNYKHKIKMKDPNTKPIYIPAYRCAHSQRQLVTEAVKRMEQQGVVESAQSPWSAPILIIPKKEKGSYRTVVDFRQLNKQLLEVRCELPTLQEIILSLNDACIFSTFDLMDSFHQIEVHEESRDILAFVWFGNQNRFTTLPQGLKVSSAVFQLLMLSVLKGMVGDYLQVFIDDIILWSSNFEEHLEKLDIMLQRIQDSGLKLKLSKSKFMQEQVKFLGHFISKGKISPDQEKLKALKEYPVPGNVKQIRQFLGFTGYFRSFINKFSEMAKPISELTKKNVKFVWGSEQQNAFDNIRKSLLRATHLSQPNFKECFVVETDASDIGISACLLQESEKGKAPIAFVNRLLNSAEKNYSVTEKECLAIVFGLVKFRQYILGHAIIVQTDNLPAVSLFYKNNLTGRLARWALAVQEYAPKIIYAKGKLNLAADALSRQLNKNIKIESDNEILLLKDDRLRKLEDADRNMILQEQRKDTYCKKILKQMSQIKMSKLQDNNICFALKNEILCVILKEDIFVYIPGAYLAVVFEHCHKANENQHFNLAQTTSNFNKRFYAFEYKRYFAYFYNNCKNCNQYNDDSSEASSNKKWQNEEPIFALNMSNESCKGDTEAALARLWTKYNLHEIKIIV